MKGSWFTLEAVIACMLIAFFLIFLARNHISAEPDPVVSGLAFQALSQLDDMGLLREYAQNNDFTGISGLISLPGYSHAVNVCGTGGQCAGPSVNASQVWVGSYFVAGKGTYNPKEVKLLLWR